MVRIFMAYFEYYKNEPCVSSALARETENFYLINERLRAFKYKLRIHKTEAFLSAVDALTALKEQKMAALTSNRLTFKKLEVEVSHIVEALQRAEKERNDHESV